MKIKHLKAIPESYEPPDGEIKRIMKLFNLSYDETKKKLTDRHNKTQGKSIQGVDEDSSQIPARGDTIRTKKMQMEGKVEEVKPGKHGYDEVYFRIADGRLMKTPLDNAIVVEKLADEEFETMEEHIVKHGKGYRLLSHKGKNLGDFGSHAAAEKHEQEVEYFKHANEGTMGGINRSAPAQDVSYEHVLDDPKIGKHDEIIGEVYKKWVEENKKFDKEAEIIDADQEEIDADELAETIEVIPTGTFKDRLEFFLK